MSNLELAAISYLQVVCLTFVGSSQQLFTYDDFKVTSFVINNRGIALFNKRDESFWMFQYYE